MSDGIEIISPSSQNVDGDGRSEFCYSCNSPDANFSKSQKKKKKKERKCVICVEKKMIEFCSQTRAADPTLDRKTTHRSMEEKPFVSMKDVVDGGAENGDKSHEDVKSDHDELKIADDNINEIDGNVQTDFGVSGSSPPDNKNKLPAEKEESAIVAVPTIKNKNHELEDSESEHEFDPMDESGNWSPLQRDEDDDALDQESSNHLKRKRNGNEEVKRESVREKMAKARKQALNGRKRNSDSDRNSDDDFDADHSDVQDDDNEKELSLEELKRKIMGRSVKSMYDMDTEASAFSPSNQSKFILDPSTFADGVTAADHLRPELTCPVCYDRFYNPVSLLCGHSFCQSCLMWWLKKSGGGKSSETEDERWEQGNGASNAQPSSGGTCPSCRNPIPAQQNGKPMVQINTALKACMNALYGSEMNQRRLAEEREKCKATRGEKGGLHNKGNEVLVPLQEEDNAGTNQNEIKDEENGWVSIVASSPSLSSSQRGASTYNRSRGTKISIRRNIILDNLDQRCQISLAFSKCEYSMASRPACTIGGVVDVELCLLSMEEDEVGDSGFPAIVVDGSDDEALICAGNDRVHTCIESSATVAAVSDTDYTNTSSIFGRANDGSHIKEIPLSRGMIGRDGSVRFRFDLNQIMDNAKAEDGDLKRNFRVVKLKFHHADTGAALELRPPSKDVIEMQLDQSLYQDDDEIEYETTSKPSARTGVSRYFMNSDDEEEEHEEHYNNEYENDDFLVGDDCESEVEAEHEDGDENDECHICKHGGDLIICDGGDHEGGCGQAYHISCINRIVVPPGDWICNLCANNLGLDVGVEGHEWEEDEGENTKSDAVVENVHPKAAGVEFTDDDSEGDIVPARKRKRPSQQILDECDEDESERRSL